MPTFNLGECSLDLTIEPLTGPYAIVDRQTAWQVYLELVTRPPLRADTASNAEIAELVGALRHLMATWPAAQIEEAHPKQLGAVVLALIDMVLLPCLLCAQLSASGWKPVRVFCQEIALELARLYRFHEIGTALPADLHAAWEKER